MKTVFLLISLLTYNFLNAQTPSWQWANGTGRYTSHDYCKGLSTDVYGNSYITGEFQDTIDFGPYTLPDSGTYNSMMYIAKYNSSGNVSWAKTPGGNNGSTGNSVVVDKDGNCIVTGAYRGTIVFGTTSFSASGIGNYFVAKYDSSGNPLWANNAICTHASLGNSVCSGADGSVYVTGGFEEDSVITFGSTTVTTAASIIGNSIFVVKYDSNGNIIWAKGAGGRHMHSSNSISTDKFNNVFITGIFHDTITFDGISLYGSNGSATVFVVKYDDAGNVVWAKSSGGFPSSGYGTGISTDGNGNCFVAGYFNSPIIIFDGDTLTNAGVEDIFVLKYDGAGNLMWANRAGGNNYDEANAILTDENGNSYVTGFVKVGAYFNSTLIAGAGQVLFVAKYDSAGSVLWAVKADGNLNERGNSIGIDGNNNIYIGGEFSSPTAIFGLTTLTNSDLFLGSYDLFLAKIDHLSAKIHETDRGKFNIGISPNPFSTHITLTFDNFKNENLYLLIYDIHGRVVRTIENIKADHVEIERGNLTGGLYLFRLKSDKELYASGKLIVD